MSSKRKTCGETAVRRVMEAINKIGCEVHDFFDRVPRIVDVPPGFNAKKEAIRFNLFRQGGVADHPDYQIPTHVLEAAETIHAADCPKKFYADLQSRARMTARQTAKELLAGSASSASPGPVMRQQPRYA